MTTAQHHLDLLRTNLERALRGDPMPSFRDPEFIALVQAIDQAGESAMVVDGLDPGQATLMLTLLDQMLEALKESAEAQRALAIALQGGQTPC